MGGAALGATFAIASDSSTTKAYIVDSNVGKTGAIDVNAETDSEIRNYAASGAVGAAGSVAGSALVSLINNKTEAYVKDSNLGGSGANAADSVSVFAHDKVTVANIAGAAGLDITAGVGASAAITRIDNTTSAYIEGGSIYTAGTDSDDFGVSVSALAERDLSSVAVSGGAGLVDGIGGAAVATLVGTRLSGKPLDELNKDGQGTLNR